MTWPKTAKFAWPDNLTISVILHSNAAGPPATKGQFMALHSCFSISENSNSSISLDKA